MILGLEYQNYKEPGVSSHSYGETWFYDTEIGVEANIRYGGLRIGYRKKGIDGDHL